MEQAEKTPLSRVTAVRRLIEQDENHGYFAQLCGPEPFRLLIELGIIEFMDLGGEEPETIAALRIYHFGWPTIHEGEYEIVYPGQIRDRNDVLHEPEELLSVESSIDGWGISNLKPRYGKVLKEWLAKQARDQTDG